MYPYVEEEKKKRMEVEQSLEVAGRRRKRPEKRTSRREINEGC